MTIAVTCPCGGRFAAQPHLAGKTVRCPQCQRALQVPVPPREPLAPIVNPFSDDEAPVEAELVPPSAPVAPTYPTSQDPFGGKAAVDPFGGKATVGGPATGQPYPQVTPTYPRPQSYAQPVTATYAQGQGYSRKKSNTVYYVIAAVLFGFMGFVFVVGVGIYQVFRDLQDSPPLLVQDEDYAMARARFKTTLMNRGEAPQDWDPLETPRGAEELTYQSDGHALRAFVDPPPADGQPRPGVVFLHGGFAWGESDWEMSQPYRDQGFVVMSPVLRGENGQPGEFSLYYNEVDDVLAATAAFAALPYVDETQLYISGHSAGGTLATLTAMATDRFAAMASFSGTMNMDGVGQWDPGLMVYDESDEQEALMRSPEAFAKSFKCPAQLYYGSEETWFPDQTRRTAATAQGVGLEVQEIMVPGDHMTSVRPAMLGSISFFRRIGILNGKLPAEFRALTPPQELDPVDAIQDFSIPDLPDLPLPPEAPTPSIPGRGAPDFSNQDLPGRPTTPPGLPGGDGSVRFIPFGDPPPPAPGRPNFPTPRRPPRPTGPTSRHLGVVTFEVVDYSGRLPQRMSVHRALIRSPWADFARIEIDEAAGVIRVPVKKYGPSMNTGAAKQALKEVGFNIGATTFKPIGTEDEPKAAAGDVK